MRVRARHGFMLAELLVVITILALIAGATAPLIVRAAERDPLVTAADSVVALIERARATSLQRGTVVTLTIDPGGRRWWVDTPDTAGALTLPDGVGLASTAPRVHVRFSARGGASALPLVVRRTGRTLTVLVDPWTGAVRATGSVGDAAR